MTDPVAIARLIDHTQLKPEAAADDVRRLCGEALEHGFRSVCVAPSWVDLARAALASTDIVVGTVIGFPHGNTLSEVKVLEARRAQDLGARELDMVIHIGRLGSGDLDAVRADLAAVLAVRQSGTVVKVILETGLLAPAAVEAGAGMARDLGADFVKTSTGFGPRGASEEDVVRLRRVVGPALGVKAAGGIRDLATLERMVAAGANRIGSSAGVAILAEARRRAAGGGQ